MPYLSSPSTEFGPVANLSTIKFSELLDGNDNELTKLREVCGNQGFFYLDLTGKGSRKMFQNLEELKSIMRDWFAQPLALKLKTESISLAHGYKPTGVQSGVIEASKDGFEALQVGRNELTSRWGLPSVVETHQKTFDDFSATTHWILNTLLECLSSSLGLKGHNSLSQYHRDDAPSKSTLYFLHYPASSLSKNEMGQNMHTDIGLLTLLFAPQWGLQVLSPDAKEWQLVEPREGRAIVNIGDTLRFLSGKRFRSALHRAMPIEGVDRSSVSYFLRANDGIEFKDSDGEDADAKSWYLRKYETYEKTHEVQREESVLTGGMKRELEKLQEERI